jgi:hypothetical protein
VSAHLRQFERDGVPTAKEIAAHIRLRELLQILLAVEGAIIGAALLATAGLRNAIVAWSHDPTRLPGELVLAYGIAASALLAVAYGPVYARLSATAARLVDRAFELPEPTERIWDDLTRRRRELGELLQTRTSTAASFRSGVAILTPLGGALIGLLLKSG